MGCGMLGCRRLGAGMQDATVHGPRGAGSRGAQTPGWWGKGGWGSWMSGCQDASGWSTWLLGCGMQDAGAHGCYGAQDVGVQGLQGCRTLGPTAAGMQDAAVHGCWRGEVGAHGLRAAGLPPTRPSLPALCLLNPTRARTLHRIHLRPPPRSTPLPPTPTPAAPEGPLRSAAPLRSAPQRCTGGGPWASWGPSP